jgi:hypothetical protein
MDARTREEIRCGVSHNRIRPQDPQRIFFESDGLGECPPLESGRAVALHIEATSPAGILSPWLTDEWWIGLQQRCPQRGVSAVILPTPGGVLQEVLLHQLEMIRRVAPAWRLIGYAFAEDAGGQPALDRWLNTPYDEIRFCTAGDSPVSRRPALAAAQRLVRQAALLRRTTGARQACLRLTQVPAPRQRRDSLLRCEPAVDEVRVRQLHPVESP